MCPFFVCGGLVAKPSSELDTLLSETIAALGFDYVGCEYHPQARGASLRIFVEKRDGHITIDECADVSRQVNAVLAVEDTIAGDYTLEVSSPGLERQLFRAEHYIRFIGEKARVRLYHPRNGQRNFIGIIEAADQQTLTLNVAGQPVELAIADIDKSRLIAEFDI